MPYPATSRHRVIPVTRRVRLASVFRIQGMGREDGQRALLFDFDMAINQVNQAVPDHPGVVALTAAIATCCGGGQRPEPVTGGLRTLR